MQAISVTEIDGVISFLKSVSWTERWLWILICIHLVLVILTVIAIVRDWTNVQIVVFLTLLFGVYNAEPINEWAAKNYKLFSDEQYFDHHGVFISLLFSVPLLLVCLVIVITWIYQAGRMLTLVGASRIKRKKRAHPSNNPEDVETSYNGQEETQDKKSL